MPKYRMKSDVEAVQWDGTKAGFDRIAAGHGYVMEWVVADVPGGGFPRVHGAGMSPRDWVVIDSAGSYVLYTDEEFHAVFEPSVS